MPSLVHLHMDTHQIFSIKVTYIFNIYQIGDSAIASLGGRVWTAPDDAHGGDTTIGLNFLILRICE